MDVGKPSKWRLFLARCQPLSETKVFQGWKKCGEDAVDIPAAVQLKRFVL